MRLLGTDRHDRARSQSGKGLEHWHDERLQVAQTVRWSDQQQNAERQGRDGLLVDNVLVHCHERIEASGGMTQELPIGDTRPTQPGYRVDFVITACVREANRQVSSRSRRT